MQEADQNLLNSLGQIFLDIRHEKGLSQREAAKLANSTQARLSDIENAKADMKLLNIQRWANIYGYDVQLAFTPISERENIDGPQ
jgi:transcriptional regulator with XRE-family HTH domain